MLVKDGMFMDRYHELYLRLVPENNKLRKLLELSDFGFAYDELQTNYCLDNGRNATSPILLMKYLILKIIYRLSDEDVVDRTLYDLSFKYFLELDPMEVELIHPATLTKFRRKRLKDSELLNQLIGESIAIAKKHQLIESSTLILDSTHTRAKYNLLSPREALIEESKELRKTVYGYRQNYHDKFPAKPNSGLIEDHLEYCGKLIAILDEDPTLLAIPAVQERYNYVKEMITDNLEHIKLSYDEEAKVGHKTADTNFFGYKTHLAINEERLVTAVVVTSGEKHDGKQLVELVEQSQRNGVEVKEVIGDGAYSELENLNYSRENDITLIAKLSQGVVNGSGHKGNRRSEFHYNKDAQRYVCPAGHMAIRKAKAKVCVNGAHYPIETYFFDVEKCRHCPQKVGCYKEGSRSKSFSVSLKRNEFQDHLKFMASDEFKLRAKERYKVEAVNAHLKNDYDYRIATSRGLFGMHLQAATTVFVMNMERILTLIEEKSKA
ncbi:MAG TPA: IS1182 family transposase [Erysipelotrichaceae bacterium]|nr:IS1182 family transposase [Erysipelotrichaceae bacterium]HBZ41495.1 IS1182 family transposase [Erysipelotrichaceae bacterium]